LEKRWLTAPVAVAPQRRRCRITCNRPFKGGRRVGEGYERDIAKTIVEEWIIIMHMKLI
jgi:hypothetical protein